MALLTAVLVAQVLGTVFFALTVAYLLAPIKTRLVGRGLTPWTASAVTTTLAAVATLLLAAPLVVIVMLRLDALLALIASIPESITVNAFGYTQTITLEQALVMATRLLRTVGRQAVVAAPILLTKLALFGFLVFAVVQHHQETRRALLAIVPPEYRGVAEVLNDRFRSTLFAIYVLQAATAAGTFVIALPFFFLLGYDYPITLATLCAVLQFLPIVGPSILIALLAIYHLVAGQVMLAVTVFVAGAFLVGWLPDLLIRPRLARETTHLPGSLYFIGFVGGLLTLGPIGVIAGPLAVGLLAETASMLATEFNRVPVSER